jgi:hypothetical protein
MEVTFAAVFATIAVLDAESTDVQQRMFGGFHFHFCLHEVWLLVPLLHEAAFWSPDVIGTAMRRLRERRIAAASNAEEETGGHPYSRGAAGEHSAAGRG